MEIPLVNIEQAFLLPVSSTEEPPLLEYFSKWDNFELGDILIGAVKSFGN